MPKKVFVSGSYDMLHSGHVAFFEEAASYGELYVGIGSDKTIEELKARKTINSEAERLYMVRALKVVKEAWINTGSGMLDFVDQLKALKPDIFFVNTDGHTHAKEELCRELGIQYIVSHRIPHGNLPVRSTTALRQVCMIPYRIDLAGGWLDQPYVSKYHPGAVLTVSIEPDYEFNHRSGMATSSRNKAIELWQTDIPDGDREKMAKILFSFENPPGTKYVSGSQDSLGIALPGLNRLNYRGGYWPETIDKVFDEKVLKWMEEHLWLIPLFPRVEDYDVLAGTRIDEEGARELARAADACWEGLNACNLEMAGKAMSDSFEAQIRMFPNMVTEEILSQLETYKPQVKGWKLSGAGGGGYFILLNDKPVKNAIQVRIRRA